MGCPVLPQTMMGYVMRCSGRHQIVLALLSAGVFGLSTAPLELQRRIVNDAIKSGATRTILWLAAAYAGVALLEQALKLALNIYRAWVSENAVRSLRKTLLDAGHGDSSETGTHAAMVGRRGEADRRLRRHGDLRALAAGRHPGDGDRYMPYLEPWTLVLCIGFLLPQMLFVPLMQRAINSRAGKRIRTFRLVGSDIVETGVPGEERIERVFRLNMSIYRIKFSMNLGMNFMYHLAVAVALGVGGLFAVEHRIEVGTVVAVVSGLGKLNDPWGDLVNWGPPSLSVDSVKYRLFADALNGKGLATA